MKLNRTELAILAALGFMTVALVALGSFMISALIAPTPAPQNPIIAVATKTIHTETTPTITNTWTPSPSSTSTKTPTPTRTSTLTPTSTPTPTATSSFTPTPTETENLRLTTLTEWKAQNLGPYIQSVADDSVIIAWQTRKSTLGTVEYGVTETYGMIATETAPSKKHHITLTDLDPYTVYHYRVMADDAPFSEDLTFRTAAAPDQTSFSFVVYGDTQSQDSIHQSVVDRAKVLKPDFALHVGDLVNNGLVASQWSAFFQIEGEFMAEVALFPSLGNHELSSDHYFDIFYLPGNERWYSFTYGHTRLICLQIDEYTNFDVGSKQYKWLLQTLESNNKPWLFVYFHVPPYTAMSEGSDELAIRAALSPLFEQYGVDIVFSGHHHNYQRNQANGITYIVTGGGGGALSYDLEPDDYLVAYKVTYHLVHVVIEGDTLHLDAMTPSGSVFDSFSASPR